MTAERREPREMVHVRLDTELVRQIDHFAIDWRMYRADAMERLLRVAIALQEQQRELPLAM